MTGYVRKDTSNNIADGNIINAADLDAEFDGVQDAFNSSTGHTHDGTSGEGAPITVVGPVQDVVISATAVTPKTTNTVDIGSGLLKFKDIFITGTVNTTTIDTTNLEVTNIKAKDGTASIALADSTGVATLTANPVLSDGTANGVAYLNGSKVLTTGSALTFDGSTLSTTGDLTVDGNATLGNASSDTVTVNGTATLTAKPTVQLTSANTNTVTQAMRLESQSSGTPAAGIGVGMEFAAETAAGNTEVGATLEAVTTDVTSTSEDFDLVVKLMIAGAAAAETARFKSTGLSLATGDTYQINGVNVLSSTALGTGVTGSSLTSVGTIGTGTWQGTAIGATYGGTGQTVYAVGDLLYASSTTQLSKLADVATGNALISGGVGVAPAWGKIGLTTHVSGTLAETNGGTGQSTYTIGDILYADAANSLGKLADVATGNALISGGVGVAPAWGKIGLTTHVSGTLAVGNGGTGATTLTGVVYGNGTAAMTAATAAQANGAILGAQTFAAGTNYVFAEPALSVNGSLVTTAYQEYANWRMLIGGTLRFRYFVSNLSATASLYIRIYKNGVAFGTERILAANATASYTEDLAFASGDTLQIYWRSSVAGDSYFQIFPDGAANVSYPNYFNGFGVGASVDMKNVPAYSLPVGER